MWTIHPIWWTSLIVIIVNFMILFGEMQLDFFFPCQMLYFGREMKVVACCHLLPFVACLHRTEPWNTRWSSVQWSFGRDFGGSKQHQAADDTRRLYVTMLLCSMMFNVNHLAIDSSGKKQFVNSCVAGLWIRIDMLIIKLIKHWIQNQAQNQIITDLLKCTWSQEGGSWWRDWCQGLGQGATICQAHPSTLSMADGSCRNHKVIIWWSRKSCQTSRYHSTCA